MSSVEHTLISTTEDTLKDMARQQQFVPVQSEMSRMLQPEGVIVRETTSDRDDDQSSGERNIVRPAFIITYLGTQFPTALGQNCDDDGIHRLVIQLVDDVPPANSTRFATYHQWIRLVRRELNSNPYAANLDVSIADIWQVHVATISKASTKDYVVHNQMKAGLELHAYARESRT